MIDTVRVSLQDFSIVGDTRLIVQSLTEAGTGQKLSDYHLWRCADTGDIVQGRKAYYNNRGLSITLLQNRGCFGIFSVSKLCHGCNYFPIAEEDFRAVLSEVERQFREIGIRCDIAEAKLSRLDLFRNVVTEEPFSTYYPILLLLNGKRMHKRDYGTCFLLHSSRQEICVYDKINEMRSKGLDVSEYAKNTIRFEYRLMSSRKITEVLGMSSVTELLGDYGEIENCFVSAMEENFFSHEVGEAKISTKSEASSHLLTFKEMYGRQGLDRYFKSRGINNFIEELGIDVATEAVLKAVGNKMATHRYERKFQQAALDMMILRKGEFADKTLSQLYVELKRKVLEVQ